MLVLIGFVLGGSFGIVTVLTVLFSGVIIMFFRKAITNIFLRN